MSNRPPHPSTMAGIKSRPPLDVPPLGAFSPFLNKINDELTDDPVPYELKTPTTFDLVLDVGGPGYRVPVPEAAPTPKPTPPTKLYLAGPMRGIPFFNFPAFDKAAAELRAAGYEVFSPAEHDREVYGKDFELAYPTGESGPEFDLRGALATDTRYICTKADGVALLPDWDKSKGAVAEQALALAVGIPVGGLGYWLKKGIADKKLPTWGEVTKPKPRLEVPWESNWHHYAHAPEVRTTSATGGEKGVKRAQLHAVDPSALMAVAEVAGYGGEKYETYNYTKGYEWSKSYSAMQRHLHAFWGGQDLDPESGLPHMAHAAWHCLALLTFSKFIVGTDDRFPLREEEDVD